MISVCLATYNGESFIKEQLLSILEQLSVSDEIIISDDGSTDRTLEIIAELSDNRIQVLNHNKPNGVKNKFHYTTLNFQNALYAARGEYIFLADQDDIWHKDKVKVCCKALSNSDLVLHDCAVVNEKLEELWPSYFNLLRTGKGIVRNIAKNSYLGCCIAFRKRLLNKCLPFPNSEIPHDIWLGLVAEWYFKVEHVPEVLLLYRRHGGNLSASSERSANSLIFRIQYRITLAEQLLRKIIFK